MGRQKGKKERGENNIYLVSDVCNTSLLYKQGTVYKGGWMKPVNRCSPTQAFLIGFFLIKKCLWSWVKQGRETDSMPLTQEMMAKERSKFPAKPSTGWYVCFPCPIPPNRKVLKKGVKHKTLLIWRKQTESVKRQYWGSSWKHLL